LFLFRVNFFCRYASIMKKKTQSDYHPNNMPHLEYKSTIANFLCNQLPFMFYAPSIHHKIKNIYRIFWIFSLSFSKILNIYLCPYSLKKSCKRKAFYFQWLQQHSHCFQTFLKSLLRYFCLEQPKILALYLLLRILSHQ
jgi:hypothetical protein